MDKGNKIGGTYKENKFAKQNDFYYNYNKGKLKNAIDLGAENLEHRTWQEALRPNKVPVPYPSVFQFSTSTPGGRFTND